MQNQYNMADHGINFLKRVDIFTFSKHVHTNIEAKLYKQQNKVQHKFTVKLHLLVKGVLQSNS
jgi:hypothetical protein